jgi:hydroxypyruvate isomerase
MIFTELQLVGWIAAVAEAGYEAYEFWGWRNKDVAAIKEATQRAGISVSGLLLDTSATLVDPQTHEQLVLDARQAFGVAQERGASVVIATTGNDLNGSRESLRRTVQLLRDSGVLEVG